MARSIHIGPLVVQPGDNQAFEIDTPTRANGARIRLNRSAGWPEGVLFTYRVFERERNGVLTPLTSATENGGEVIGRGGVLNPPLIVELNWQADRDKDVIRFEVDVFQPFTTEVFIDFL